MKIARLMFGLCMAWGLSITGCNGSSTEEVLLAPSSAGVLYKQVSYNTLHTGTDGSIGNNSPQINVFRNEVEWANFWNLLYANQTPKPTLPSVDFSVNVIISVVDTVKPKGGYSIAITQIQPTSSGVTVSASQMSPGQNCTSTAVLTEPYHIVSTPIFSGVATLELSQKVLDCGSSENVVQQVSFNTLQTGAYGSLGNNSPQINVFRNEVEWANFWNLLYANQTPKPALPSVDFSVNVIISAVDTVKPKGGYSIAITQIQPTSTGATVSASQISPGQNCLSAAVLTEPYHIVSTPIFSGVATLELSQKVLDCGP